jgi:tRNA(His) 5'-end guanylyltransferase
VADDLGDRMKAYEQAEAGRAGLPGMPVCVRLDGKGFSRWTRSLARPFDPRLTALMIDTTLALVAESGAVAGYTQSDEISLILHAKSAKEELYHGGKFQKLASVLASVATAHFNAKVWPGMPPAIFDARAWAVPSLDEAANVLFWREIDATKNSVSMAAREHYSHKALLGLKRAEMMDLLMAKGVNWNDYPAAFKRGTHIQRVWSERAFTAAEIAALPERHEARVNPGLVVRRSEVRVVDLPPLSKVPDRVAALFPEVGR